MLRLTFQGRSTWTGSAPLPMSPAPWTAAEVCRPLADFLSKTANTLEPWERFPISRFIQIPAFRETLPPLRVARKPRITLSRFALESNWICPPKVRDRCPGINDPFVSVDFRDVERPQGDDFVLLEADARRAYLELVVRLVLEQKRESRA